MRVLLSPRICLLVRLYVRARVCDVERRQRYRDCCRLQLPHCVVSGCHDELVISRAPELYGWRMIDARRCLSLLLLLLRQLMAEGWWWLAAACISNLFQHVHSYGESIDAATDIAWLHRLLTFSSLLELSRTHTWIYLRTIEVGIATLCRLVCSKSPTLKQYRLRVL